MRKTRARYMLMIEKQLLVAKEITCMSIFFVRTVERASGLLFLERPLHKTGFRWAGNQNVGMDERTRFYSQRERENIQNVLLNMFEFSKEDFFIGMRRGGMVTEISANMWKIGVRVTTL